MGAKCFLVVNTARTKKQKRGIYVLVVFTAGIIFIKGELYKLLGVINPNPDTSLMLYTFANKFP
jgi:hypothetical protein